MKINLKGIRFKYWLYFLGYSLGILMMLGLLLMLFIRPYYRDNRLKIIDSIVETIEDRLINNVSSDDDVKITDNLLVNNNVCALIYNENGSQVYSSDSLGQLCMLNQEITVDEEKINVSYNPRKFINILKDKGSFSIVTDGKIEDYSMIVYAKKIESDLANFYLAVNTPLEPLDSYVSFVFNQYTYLAIIIIVMSFVISFFLSYRITEPILKMNKEANRLAQGDYNANFKMDKGYSEIKELSKTLDDATNKLGKIDELRKDLIANVSHDLKTPLTTIKAYSEMIKDISGDDPVKRNEHIDVILKEVDYLSHLINDMQELSKMQAGIIEPNLENFDIKDTVKELLNLLEPIANSKHIELVDESVAAIIYGDELKLSQVIYNFVSNAIKHSYENSKVIIKVIESEDKTRVEVIDFGEGIKEEDINLIWDRYYKVDKNFKRNHDSTGLGLAIAKAILEAHGASYGVVSKEKEGSTFYFEIKKNL